MDVAGASQRASMFSSRRSSRCPKACRTMCSASCRRRSGSRIAARAGSCTATACASKPTYAVQGRAAQTIAFTIAIGGLQQDVYTKPVGILFHTSESDLWPLEADFEQQLRRSSARLCCATCAKQQAYNYLIDRFGRVYRIVDDETRANHAGHAVWARDDEVYLDLNSHSSACRSNRAGTAGARCRSRARS